MAYSLARIAPTPQRDGMLHRSGARGRSGRAIARPDREAERRAVAASKAAVATGAAIGLWAALQPLLASLG